jgi:hypothetical protein
VWTGEVRARASVPLDRQLPDGRFRTASEYLWRIDQFELEPDSLRLLMAADSSKLSFDPAKPPPGYTLCHGGHCHATDGRLVDYADIQAELLGESGGGAEVSLPLTSTLTLAPEFGVVAPTGEQALSMGALATLRLGWRGLRLRARVWDARTTAPRLPPEGIALEVRLPADGVSAQLSGRTGPHQPLRWHTALELDLPVMWLDPVDPAALAGGATSVLIDDKQPEVAKWTEALHARITTAVNVRHVAP